MIRAVREVAGSTTIERQFDESGAVVHELFKAPKGKIMLSRKRRESGDMEEVYFVKAKVVSADKYEKARAEFPDMPAANGELDHVGRLLRDLRGDVRREKLVRKKAQKTIALDPVAAGQKDARCREILAQPDCLSLEQFRNTAGAVLGTLSARGSRTVVERFAKLGAADITVWGVSHTPGELVFCEGLIVGLPQDAAARAALFKQAGKISAAAGFEPEVDVGQSLLFVRFE